MIRISHRTYLPGIWAGGTTKGIWAEPADAISSPAAARWWVGTAVIERDAPYSFFAGRSRLHLPIHGDGLRLHFRNPSEEVVLARNTPYQFHGEWEVDATLVDGPVIAFNLIYRADGIAAASVVTVGADELVWPRPALEQGVVGTRELVQIVYSIAGAPTISAGAEQAVTLARDDTLVVPAHQHVDTMPQLFLMASDAAPATVVLATLWLPTDITV
ncbi:MAG: HutD family protein [Roseiflexaceae bacterium]|nr:HutD family protein [Roseiflexaceae bacterium]